MKITKQLQFTIVGLAALAGVSTLALDFSAQRSESDGRVVNTSGLVRGGAQRWVKFEVEGEKRDQISDAVEANLEGLLNGSDELNLPAAPAGAYRDKMLEVQEEWAVLEAAVAKFRGGNSTPQQLVQVSEDFFELTNEAVKLAETTAVRNVTQQRLANGAVLLLNLSVLGFIAYILKRASDVLQGSVSTMAGTSSTIAETVEKQEKIIQEQTSSVKTTTSSMEELGSNTLQTATQAQASARDAQNALSVALEGSETVEKTTAAMQSLKDQVGDIAKQIMQLSEQTAQIESISKLVSDVADQTNMLSLNAAVEAARAGEQGKGFAVVAGEIRKLADQSGRSAEKIGTLIADIQSSINSTIMVTDEGTKTAATSLALADETSSAFANIRAAMEGISQTNEKMAATAKLQAVTVQQSVSSMNAINLGAQEASSSTQQVKESTSNLSELSKELSLTV